MDDRYKIMTEIYNALKELVELKQIKETEGETEDYQKRKPLAWSTAKRVIAKYKNGSQNWGVMASKHPEPPDPAPTMTAPDIKTC